MAPGQNVAGSRSAYPPYPRLDGRSKAR